MVFVVAYMSYFDNELILEQITAENWRDAVCKHSKTMFTCVDNGRKDQIVLTEKMTIEEMKQIAFDCDVQMAVIQIEGTA